MKNRTKDKYDIMGRFQKRKLLIVNILGSALVGYFFIHPISHIILQLFHFYPEEMHHHIEFKNIFNLIFESFSLQMFPMGLIFVIIFSMFGFIIGKQKEKLELRYIIIQNEQNKREKLKKEFDAYLRHEINNLITPIMGYTGLLLNNKYNKLNEEQIKYLSIIENASNSIADMNSIFRDIEKYEEGKIELNKTFCKITDVIEYSISMVHLLAEKSHVKIELEYLAENENVKVDTYKMNSVFQNLLKNAVEHVESLENQTVIIKVYNKNEKVIVEINNKGETIPKERLERFFDKFNTSGKKMGTGLGTTLAYNITKLHGGDISVRSNPDEGTTVTVELNCAFK